MNVQLLDRIQNETGDIQIAFYQEPDDNVYVFLTVGAAGIKIPSNLVGDFLEAADAIRIYFDDTEDDEVE